MVRKKTAGLQAIEENFDPFTDDDYDMDEEDEDEEDDFELEAKTPEKTTKNKAKGKEMSNEPVDVDDVEEIDYSAMVSDDLLDDLVSPDELQKGWYAAVVDQGEYKYPGEGKLNHGLMVRLSLLKNPKEGVEEGNVCKFPIVSSWSAFPRDKSTFEGGVLPSWFKQSVAKTAQFFAACDKKVVGQPVKTADGRWMFKGDVCLGPDLKAARLEATKSFAKRINAFRDAPDSFDGQVVVVELRSDKEGRPQVQQVLRKLPEGAEFRPFETWFIPNPS